MTDGIFYKLSIHESDLFKSGLKRSENRLGLVRPRSQYVKKIEDESEVDANEGLSLAASQAACHGNLARDKLPLTLGIEKAKFAGIRLMELETIP